MPKLEAIQVPLAVSASVGATGWIQLLIAGFVLGCGLAAGFWLVNHILK